VFEAEEELRQAHGNRFSVHTREGIFAMRTQPSGHVIIMPRKKTDGFPDRNYLEAKFHLAPKPNMIPNHTIFGGVGASLPNPSCVKKGTGLDRHVPIRISGAGKSKLVE